MFSKSKRNDDVAAYNVPMLIRYERQTVTRDQAMKQYNSLMTKNEEDPEIFNMAEEIEKSFTKQAIKVLPSYMKSMILRYAQLGKNTTVERWMAEAGDSLKEYTWVERVETPAPPEHQARVICQELRTIADTTFSDTKRLMHSRIQMMQKLFEAQEQRIQDLVCKIECRATIESPQTESEPDEATCLEVGPQEELHRVILPAKLARTRRQKRTAAMIN
ncbi:hypothetical protein TARUN_9274 [Trichoderma arundinaceum]|uniref:Uncharacterized protein n=1 Tax=Trichoderma arundinaceum TaxID=490622 RepID=A0A395NAR8_TRIAR|nr:hypothetical protein TARUN_9274 [Trichoderma arundinaceum]